MTPGRPELTWKLGEDTGRMETRPMLDDVGFGAMSTFGGPVPAPALDRIAERGLRAARQQLVNAQLSGLC